MAEIFKRTTGALAMTPHKVSVCIMLQIYATPPHITLPFPFSSVAEHNRIGLYLMTLIKSCDDMLEPKFEHLLNQLRAIGGSLDHWLIDHLTNRLSTLSSPDDLFNFFNEMRGILGASDLGVVDDDQVILDPNSNLGLFLRRCILAFNLLSFEGVCHLLTAMTTYCKEASCLHHSDDSFHDMDASDNNSMDWENFDIDRVIEEIDAKKRAREKIPFHFHAPKTLSRLVEDFRFPTELKSSHRDKVGEPPSDVLRDTDPDSRVFLRTTWQVQGYLMEQADAIEKSDSSFSSNDFELILKQLQKLAPDLHRVHYLRYLNNLYHSDYFTALENLHSYFDYCAGTEGFDFITSSGRYEIALLCLGMLHFQFGHPRQALEVLTEAIRVSQQFSELSLLDHSLQVLEGNSNREHGNDSCLAYTLAGICHLLSEIGISSTTGILGRSCSPMTNIGTSLSVQQQLFVLLKDSLKGAENLKLKRLMASNHLAMAKFNLTHVQRSMLSFGPNISMKLKTCPINVCKEVRLGYRLISEFDSESCLTISDGALSTTWLKNMQKPVGSLVLFPESQYPANFNAFHFCAQQSSIPASVLQFVGCSYLLRATVWEIYGSSPLAQINTLVYATCFADASSSSDLALAHVKLIQHLSVFKGYREAVVAFKIAEEKFISVSKSRMLLLKLQLLHDRALHIGHLKLAHQLCAELEVSASPVNGVDIELKTEASLRRARTFLAANQFSQAAAVAQSLFCTCYKYNLQIENATVLLLLAEIHKKSGNAVLGLSYALACLSFCQSLNLDLLKASANLMLAELWLSLGSSHSKKALTLVHGALPLILGHGGLELRARAHMVEAKCYLFDPKFSVTREFDMVLDPLQLASDHLQVLEYHELAAECFYLMAIIYDKLGQLERREEAASSFKKHLTALENSHNEEDPLCNSL